MRKIIALTAAAPLALLAACGGSDADDADTMASAETATTAAATDTADADPAPATALADAGDFSGAYGYTADDGTSAGVRLNSEDDTYEYVGADGTTYSGSYTRDADGYRIRMADWMGGGDVWFAISNGDLVRLQQDSALTPDITVEGERYTRDSGDAVFSRFPELGSPVAPEMD